MKNNTLRKLMPLCLSLLLFLESCRAIGAIFKAGIWVGIIIIVIIIIIILWIVRKASGK